MVMSGHTRHNTSPTRSPGRREADLRAGMPAGLWSPIPGCGPPLSQAATNSLPRLSFDRAGPPTSRCCWRSARHRSGHGESPAQGPL